MRQLLTIIVAVVGGVPVWAEVPLATQAKDLLRTHCYRCHGEKGSNEGGFNFVLDGKQLVARKKIVAGIAGQSKLLQRMLHADDPMPPADEKQRPTKAELAVLAKWIDAGAVWEAVPERAFVSTPTMLQRIADDLKTAPERDRPYWRYFTLTHLANAGHSDDEIASFRHGIAKLINSLSWHGAITVPKPIDAAQTILRLDLRDYQWTAKTWLTLLGRHPYGVQYDDANAKAIATATQCDTAYVRGDWFVASASRPPLYHDLLNLPTTERELEQRLRIDTAANLAQERVARAGFNGSGVSRNNRLIERHETSGVIYWRSYDFAANVGRQNLFAYPLGPDGGRNSFEHDGGEIIFTLPNHLQAYFLTDNKGNRIDKGPTAIVSDPKRPDRAVENGLSCMSCHARGIIAKNDQIRAHVAQNPDGFNATTSATIRALYPERATLAALMQADAKRFATAVQRTGAPVSVTEPITALALRFEAEMPLDLVAAEIGVPAHTLLQGLKKSSFLAQHLGALRVADGTIQRQVFVDTFPELIETLQLGTYHASTNVVAVRLYRQGVVQYERRAYPEALAFFDKALAQEPNLAEAHAAKGDALRHAGQHAEAFAAYREALRLDPRQSQTFNNRGLLWQKLGKHADALADFSAALRLDPQAPAVLYNRGAAHFATGQPEQAIADYTEALKQQPNFSRAFNNRGYAYLDQDAPDKAIADFSKAIEQEPTFAIAYSNRGLAHLKKEAYAAAVADCTKAITLDAKLAHAYLNRSEAYRHLGKSREADADRKKALMLDPSLE